MSWVIGNVCNVCDGFAHNSKACPSRKKVVDVAGNSSKLVGQYMILSMKFDLDANKNDAGLEISDHPALRITNKWLSCESRC